MVAATLLMLSLLVYTPESVREHNCEYFQTELAAIRECATLPNCTVESNDLAYALSREKKWCKK